MIPKFRIWDKANERMHDVVSMWLDRSPMVVVRNGETVDTIFYNFEFMQSTGLKDKNDVEIFEGDIVKDERNGIGYVAYLQQEAGFVVVLKKSDYRLGHRNTGESYDVAAGHEIIGNIYESPELLEVS